MSIELNNGVRIGLGRFSSQRWFLFLVLLLAGMPVRAEDAAINNLEFSSLAGNQVQIQLETSGGLVEPKIFQTDNPSRIALDFAGVKSNLAKKVFRSIKVPPAPYM